MQTLREETERKGGGNFFPIRFFPSPSFPLRSLFLGQTGWCQIVIFLSPAAVVKKGRWTTGLSYGCAQHPLDSFFRIFR